MLNSFIDIHVASFFSIHRPISVTTTIPRRSTDSAFSNIFLPREQRRHEPSDVIYTISAAVDNIEDVTAQSQRQAESQEVPDQQAAITQPSVYNAEPGNDQNLDVRQPQTIHLNLQELAKNFRPFVAPPTPVPMDPKEPADLRVQRISRNGRPITRKEYTTTLTITESTYPNGYKIYRARTSPLVGEPVQEQAPNVTMSSPVRQRFLNHMRERHRQLEQWREKGPRKEIWQTLSVKRQRRLKMKKHKYRKLMRRTRTLRRRLDRN